MRNGRKADTKEMDRWLRTDEAEDVAGSLRHALRCLSMVDDDPQAWKWVAISLHSALQGACVSHLTTTAAPLGAITPKNASEFIAYLNELDSNPDARPPKTQLMSLPDLLKAVRKQNSAGNGCMSKAIVISDAELSWLKHFHETVRNQFTHFEPVGWSLEVSGIPAIARLIARIISEIADAGWAFRHKDEDWVAALKNNINELSSTSD
jgi:hypothetical protein